MKDWIEDIVGAVCLVLIGWGLFVIAAAIG